jgi:hypothetical protein
MDHGQCKLSRDRRQTTHGTLDQDQCILLGVRSLPVEVDSSRPLEVAGEGEFNLGLVSLWSILFGVLEPDFLFSLVWRGDGLSHGGLESRSFRLESVLGEFGATETELHGEDPEGDLSGVTSRLPLSLAILANTVKAVVSKKL